MPRRMACVLAVLGVLGIAASLILL
jgi:hypothetical protein